MKGVNKKIIALNIAEKPSVAKAICEHLCKQKGGARKYGSVAQWNPVFEFYYQIRKQPVSMIVTSVLGHIKNYQFPATCKSWQTTPYENLFSVKLEKVINEK